MQVNDPAEWVKVARFRRGWSVRAAAQAAGLSNTTWGRIESRDTTISPKTGRAIGEAFGWPAEWWTGSEAPEASTPPGDADGLLDRVAELERVVPALARALVSVMRGVVAEEIVEQAELDELLRSLPEADPEAQSAP